jgi:hypothetical protein
LGAGEPPAAPPRSVEQMRVRVRRFCEAREAGLNMVAAERFAESDVDIGELRRLVRMHCPPHLIARLIRPL